MDTPPQKPVQSVGRSKLLIIGSVAVIAILAAVGIGVGVGVSQSHSKTAAVSSGSQGGGGGGSGSGGSGGSGGGGGPNNTDPNLKKVFWGIAYTPDWALPDFGCNITQTQVTRDISLLAQLTPRIRLYSSGCNQTAMVFEAIKQIKANMQVFIGISVTENADADYTSQRDAALSAIKTYGTDYVLGITVGNEFMLNYLTDHGGADPSTSVGDTGAAYLIAKINDTRSALANLKLGKTIPVGNAEAGFYFNTNVLKAIDFGLSNVHAWFASTTITDAASWVFQYFHDTNVVPASQLSNNPKMYVAETGWPTASSDAATAVNGGGAAASVANLQIFIDNFVCQANSQGVGYFFFEYMDEQWKEYRFGGVEGHWGLFDKNYNLKNITLPDCVLK